MKLPSVFANKIDKVIHNNEDYYHNKDSRDNVVFENNNSESLKKYFDENGYARKLLVNMRTKDGISLERLILCKDDYVINIDNKRIYFKDIIDYEIKK